MTPVDTSTVLVVSSVPPSASVPARHTSPGRVACWHPRPPTAARALSSNPPDAGQDHGEAVLVLMNQLAPGAVGRSGLRAQAIEWFLPMAVLLARRFAGRGEPLADLTQVAAIGLMQAVDRFDINRGTAFASYAMPTINGELKRYFRDSAWIVRVPRRLQELKPRLGTATEELAQELRESPSAGQLAARLEVSRGDVLLARNCATAYRPVSIERPVLSHSNLHLVDTLAADDRGHDAVDDRETLQVLLATLPARDQQIVRMRFYGDMTQTQIAAKVGISQMHVSRLLTRSLAVLHSGMHDGDRTSADLQSR